MATPLEKTYKWAMRRYYLRLLAFSLIYWNLVIRFIIFLRLLGNKGGYHMESLSKGIKFLRDEFVYASLVISLFATLSWFAINFVYPQLIRRWKMRNLTIGIITIDIIVFFFISILLCIIHYSVEKGLGFDEAVSFLPHFLFNTTILFFLLILFIGGYVFQLITTLWHQIGFAPLGKIMVGFYQKPREEERIFMFLDLQSSTSTAEKLGHEKYSYFIQDCFRYISKSLLATHGRVYQFVGDEVVITWNSRKKINYKNAIDFFFLYQESLARHRAYFEQEYNLFPIFSASLNAGKVMAAEVGQIKRELAFHGDVLNTAARIQKQCKRYRKQILVTRNFALQLVKKTKLYKAEYVDDVKFFGKKKSIKIYEVEKST